MTGSAATPDRFADLNGLRICYRQDGSPKAPAVFLIAGLGMQLIEWPQELVDGLAKNFRVIRLDNRDSGLSARCGGPFSEIPPGFEWSGSAKGLAAYGRIDMADDVLALADHLEIPQFTCIGFSMGGMIVQLLATRAPERMTRFASLSSTGGDATVTANDASLRLIERFFLLFPSEADAIEAIRESNCHFSVGLMPLHGPENHQFAKALSDRAADDGGYLRDTFAITTSPPWRDKLAGKEIPALFMHGGSDLSIDVASAQSLANDMPRATLRINPGFGHWIDGETCRQALDWLQNSAPREMH
ncbi:alpha/beta hydrolase [Breoghania sp.]|uniref:alpha/beta fold hydrolase n=1 Tax=Breoghania sp. TaxID=2065378 RepID=UPI00261F7B2E|nr:alpha/beta hydrolase [Breoghania sp.]MDJ0930585.1 alpha/beta hydrolase [Breoghania sp.]